MFKIVRQSVVKRPMRDQLYIEFEDPKLVCTGNRVKCKEWLGNIAMKLNGRRINYAYDDLNIAVRVEVAVKHNLYDTRIVEYRLIQE